MHVIKARNVNEALYRGIQYLQVEGIEEQSRNGRVLVAPGPVCTVYSHPRERVLFSPARDANPFFHLMESLWMLAGRNDLEFPRRFNSKFGEYSDDGVTVPGAYGYRWRRYFAYDQLNALIVELKANPESRRAVLAMWDGGAGDLYDAGAADDFGGTSGGDLARARNGSKDVPCNTHVYFDVRAGVLNMTVCCRSNDIIWGAYGANAVHFSVLQEYMALRIGVAVGEYRQISNNYHLYPDVIGGTRLVNIQFDHFEPNELLIKIPLFAVGFEDEFHRDLGRFMSGDVIYNEIGWRTMFFADVARPMYISWMERKNKQSDGLEWVRKIRDEHWRKACVEWIERREKK